MAAQPPLADLKVLEFAGLAPGPFAGMLLADAGASVLRIDRAAPQPVPSQDLLTRHKASIAVDLKSPATISLIKEIARTADVLIDPFRPGVLERLGLGPNVLCDLNDKLIYARLTGLRRDGKYKDMAGHDINYLAVSGVLGHLGRSSEKPNPPLNILADFAGGGATLFQGILLALAARQRTGKGQIVETNMVDGASYLATFPRFALKTPIGGNPRGKNLLDTGCPYYDTYKTRDGKFVAVGALEPQFFSALMKGMRLEGLGWEEKRYDPASWPEFRQVLTDTFKTKRRSEWEDIFDGTDACCTPVLDFSELESDPQREGDQRPSVALHSTPCLPIPSDGGYNGMPLLPGQGGEGVLREWLGWTRGVDFHMRDGSLVLKRNSKL